ncbi:MAG TPA: glycerol-3-phosphate dehydrogenase [Candidatus Limnocylindria bacterium]|nr:glycerol-3-phosphate dehydrogenase [Candidatus Limnocylindria bacterium]
MAVITIVGAGMMGSAMSFPATDNGHEVRIVGTPLDAGIIQSARETGWHPTLKRQLPQGIRYYLFEELGEALPGADLLISGVSSFGVDWFIGNVIPAIPQGLPVLSVTKGLLDTEDGGLVTFPDLYARAAPGISFNAVGGPCTSYELADRDPTQVCFCGPDMGTLRRVKALLNTDYYHASLSTDVMGVECAVAMKNAYALGVTLAVGLSERTEGAGGRQHYNSQAALFGQAVREMRKLIAHVGGHDDNIVYGAGDLYVTVFGGRTRLIGTLLGRGHTIAQALDELQGVTLESVVIATRAARAVRRLIELGRANAADYPLLMHVDRVLNFSEPVNIPWDAFETELEYR